MTAIAPDAIVVNTDRIAKIQKLQDDMDILSPKLQAADERIAAIKAKPPLGELTGDWLTDIRLAANAGLAREYDEALRDRAPLQADKERIEATIRYIEATEPAEWPAASGPSTSGLPALTSLDELGDAIKRMDAEVVRIERLERRLMQLADRLRITLD